MMNIQVLDNRVIKGLSYPTIKPKRRPKPIRPQRPFTNIQNKVFIRKKEDGNLDMELDVFTRAHTYDGNHAR